MVQAPGGGEVRIDEARGDGDKVGPHATRRSEGTYSRDFLSCRPIHPGSGGSSPSVTGSIESSGAASPAAVKTHESLRSSASSSAENVTRRPSSQMRMPGTLALNWPAPVAGCTAGIVSPGRQYVIRNVWSEAVISSALTVTETLLSESHAKSSCVTERASESSWISGPVIERSIVSRPMSEDPSHLSRTSERRPHFTTTQP